MEGRRGPLPVPSRVVTPFPPSPPTVKDTTLLQSRTTKKFVVLRSVFLSGNKSM